jgi:hypothetical protein
VLTGEPLVSGSSLGQWHLGSNVNQILRKKISGKHGETLLVIPATEEAEVGGIQSEDRPGKSMRSYLKKKKTKNLKLKGLRVWLKWQSTLASSRP